METTKIFKHYVKTTEDLKLEKEFLNKIKNDIPFFEEVVKPLNINNEILSEYLHYFVECQEEFHNCQNCKDIFSCPNKCQGFHLSLLKENNFVEKKYFQCSQHSKLEEIKNNFLYRPFDDKSLLLRLSDIHINKLPDREQLIYKMNEWLNVTDFKKNWFYIYGNFKDTQLNDFLIAFSNEYSLKKLGNIAFVMANDLVKFIRDSFYKDRPRFYDILDELQSVDLLIISNFLETLEMNSIVRNEFLLPLIKFRDKHKLMTIIGSSMNLTAFTKYLAINEVGIRTAHEITTTIYKNRYSDITYHLKNKNFN